VNGYPTVLAQEADVVFGSAGHFMFYVVQAATAAILFTGGNTSFSGFPFLASFVAEDSFLPRWLTKRGHRLVFSNGIIILTVVSLALMLTVGAQVDKLIPFYAIGVFTGFSMAGFGMAKYHLRTREPGWRRKLIINMTGGVYTVLVVLIFAIVKFTEGAWLIVIIGPVLVFALIRLNREYRAEAGVLEVIGERRAAARRPARQPNYSRRVVLVFVDDLDVSTLGALRYAKSLRPTSLRAVHFVIDTARADKLRDKWVSLVDDVPLDLINCPDRRLLRATAELICEQAQVPGTQVTVILPRRSFSPLLGRLLHDRTADKIAAVVSSIPDAAATIVPFDVQSRVRVLEERQASTAAAEARPVRPAPAGVPLRDGRSARAAAAEPELEVYERPAPSPDVSPIGDISGPGSATVQGRVRSAEIRPVEHNFVLALEVCDSTGDIIALFYGRSRIPGVEPGSKIRLHGNVGMRDGDPAMINPAYELIAQLPPASGHVAAVALGV
jgi:hypothetical protein